MKRLEGKKKGESSFGVLVHEKQEKQEKPEMLGRSQSRNPHGFIKISKSIKKKKSNVITTIRLDT